MLLPVMTHYEEWLSYAGSARIELAVGLLAIACAIAYAGTRLPLPARGARPSREAAAVMGIAWAVAIWALLACAGIYYRRYIAEYHLTAGQALPPERVFPVTLAAMVVVFFVVLRRSPDTRTGLASAAIAAMAGPMIFELPFDPIVIARIYPPIPPDPAQYRALIYVPLLLTEITTLLLLRLSPMVQLTRPAFFCFALMLTVWAVWALTGFGYPSAPVPYALNVLSKLLAFATVLTLFPSQRLSLFSGSGSAWAELSWTCTVSRSAPSTRTLMAFSARRGCQAMMCRWRASGSSSGRMVAMPCTQR
jgi:hypothetical protein